MTWDVGQLNRLLSELSQLGEFRLTKFDDGKWHANIEFPSPKGVTAKCASDFKHNTPIEAMQCVHDRLGGLRNMIAVPSPVVGIAHAEVAA